MSLRERTISGILWNLSAQGGQQLLQFVLFLVLARLLVPADFGLVGMVAVFSSFAMMFADLGLGAALVQRTSLRPAHLDTAFWLSLGVGAALAVGFLLGAPLIASLYGEPALESLVRVLAVSFLIVPSTTVQKALLQRAMNFRRLVVVGFVGQLVAGGLAIALALRGAGVWSLVAHGLVSAGVVSSTLWVMSDWRPTTRLERDALRELWDFGGKLTGFNTLNYWVRHTDDFLIGRYVGADALGLYGRAYAIMLLPLTRVTDAVGQVMFPVLTRMKDDIDRSRTAYLRSVAAISFVTFPAMLGLFVVADDFVVGILGRQWEEAVPILRVFCLVGMVQSIASTVGWIFQAQGRTDWLFRWGLASGAVTISAFLIGLPWGALGVAVAYAVAGTLLGYFNFSIPGRLIGVRVRDVAQAVWIPFVLSLGMAAVVWFIDIALGDRAAPAAALTVETVVGVVVYAVSVLVVQPDAYRDVLGILTQRASDQHQPPRHRRPQTP